jgi:nitrogen PTS system EIIA component
MQLAEILAPEGVRVIGSLTSKKRLFQELAEIAAS